ncbi:MAG: molybdopterin converting factor subunit 1 [Pseudomonadales bacterium]|nr:molybdopterin converting factor subunit 1 [Pseudomonadales bacterium]
MEGGIDVTVLFFASLDEVAGCRERAVRLEEGSTVRELVAEVATMMGEDFLREFSRVPIQFAVNEAFVREQQVLHDGDTVALIPPVTGG